MLIGWSAGQRQTGRQGDLQRLFARGLECDLFSFYFPTCISLRRVSLMRYRQDLLGNKTEITDLRSPPPFGLDHDHGTPL